MAAIPGDWRARAERLEQFQTRAGSGLTIIAGGGVNESALPILAATQYVREVHVGRLAREPQVPTAPVSAARVEHLQRLLNPQ